VADMLTSLKAVATVPVYTNSRPNEYEDSIMVSTMKLEEVASKYTDIYKFASKAWRNLPTPPGCEKAFVIAWMIASENYDVNHFSISWSGSTPNTFVHLWSVINRIRTAFDTQTSSWFINSRDPVGYCTSMNMSGPADQHLYVKEIVVPQHIRVFEEEMHVMVVSDHAEETLSYTAFRLSLAVGSKKRSINVDQMAMHNRTGSKYDFN